MFAFIAAFLGLYFGLEIWKIELLYKTVKFVTRIWLLYKILCWIGLIAVH